MNMGLFFVVELKNKACTWKLSVLNFAIVYFIFPCIMEKHITSQSLVANFVTLDKFLLKVLNVMLFSLLPQMYTFRFFSTLENDFLLYWVLISDQ